ncbi:MAG: sulfatase [Planctomycetota bacterium]|jgi:arylsulfatase A-like enzyme
MNRCVVCLVALIAWAGVALGADRPNVIFFAVDDMNDWVSPMGYGQAITPHMDALAKRGVTFTNAHTAGTFCAPSRTAIFTGRHASTTGCYTTEVYFYDHPDLTPLQKAFQKGGYNTYGAGKLFHHPAGYVDLRGWTEFFVRTPGQKLAGWPLDSWDHGAPIPQHYPNSKYNQGVKPANRFFLEWGAVPDDLEEQMADTIRTNWACEVIGRDHDRPFFLGVGLYAPHFPNYAPQKYFDRYDADTIQAPPYKEGDLDDLPEPMRKQKYNRMRIHNRLVELGAVEDAIHGYLASISYADAMLGRILKALDESPHHDNTIVVLWSDHGYHHGEKGDWGKHTLWERTSNVPFIWAGPGVAKGASVDATVSLIDMYPTFVQMCGLGADEGLEGESLAGALGEPAGARDRDVLLPYLQPGAYAVINRRWRYIRYENGGEELYDVRKDPHEWTNLAGVPGMDAVKARMRRSAPRRFAASGTVKTTLKLVSEGERFRWQPKRR